LRKMYGFRPDQNLSESDISEMEKYWYYYDRTTNLQYMSREHYNKIYETR
jgi:hypothetical protein